MKGGGVIKAGWAGRCLFVRDGPDIINFQSYQYQYNKTIMIKQSPFLEKLRHQREIKTLQGQLAQKNTQLHLKESKISELQQQLAQSHGELIEENILIQEETQCSFDAHLLDRDELIHRLTSLLKEREEQGVGLHLASLQKQGQTTQLRLTLQQKQEQTSSLHSQLVIFETNILLQERNIEKIKNQKEELKHQNAKLQASLDEKEEELDALRENRQNLRILKHNAISEHIMIQREKIRQQVEMEQVTKLAIMKELLEKEVVQLKEEGEKMKKIINNYDWKLFCLQTELDLSNKEKKQYRYVNDRNEIKLTEYETQIKHNTIKIYSLEEDLKLANEDNKYLQKEISRKEMKVEELEAEIGELKELQDHQDIKELRYNIKEKDEELKEITNYLKEKINESHQYKVKCAQLEKILQETRKKAEKIEYQNYELQQNIIENQEIMLRQSQKIEQCTNQAEFLNKKMNDLSLMNLLRGKEFEDKLNSLQTTIKEKSQKINELSVQIIERQIQFNKKMEEKGEQLAELNSLQQQLNDSSEEVTHLSMLLSTKDNEIDKLVNKMNSLELNVKEKDKIIQFLQNQLKITRNQVRQGKMANQRQSEELEQAKEIIAVNDEKLKILKKEAVDNIQTELNYEFQIQSLQKKLAKLESQKLALQSLTSQQQRRMQSMKKQVREMHEISRQRIQQIIEEYARVEETTTFEVLEQQQFQVMGERQRKDIKAKMVEFNNEMDMLCSRYGSQ